MVVHHPGKCCLTLFKPDPDARTPHGWNHGGGAYCEAGGGYHLCPLGAASRARGGLVQGPDESGERFGRGHGKGRSTSPRWRGQAVWTDPAVNESMISNYDLVIEAGEGDFAIRHVVPKLLLRMRKVGSSRQYLLLR